MMPKTLQESKELMNTIFFALVCISFFSAICHHNIPALSKAIINSASNAVDLSIGLIGVMTLFLGLMKVAEEGGILNTISKLVRPIMVRLFPEVPPDHPAMGSMIMNISANILGLGNAATPFGIRAMQDLNKLNPYPDEATDSMVLFLAINTSGLTVLPTGVIALRAACGSSDPAAILPTTLFATTCSTVTAIFAAKFYSRFFKKSSKPEAKILKNNDVSANYYRDDGYPIWISICAIIFVLSLVPIAILYGKSVSPWIIPSLIIGFLGYGMIKRVKIYEVFVEGAKDGFNVAINIIPYLVAILIAVGMFQASGAMGAMIDLIGPFTSKIGLPAEALPMAILRPLSGSGAYAVLASIIKNPSIGPDSYIGYLVSTLQGSTETTFYVIAVYFGAVKIKKIRHTLIAGLTADIAGIMASVFICSILFKR